MPTVSSLLYYAAPLTSTGRDDDWCIDAVSQPPEVLFNFRKIAVETVINDLRDSAVQPKLDNMGFEKIVSSTGVDQRALVEGSASSLERYQQETGELLKSLTGADAVEFFDATLRREDADVPGDSSHQSPHLRVHVDQSPKSAHARAMGHGGPRRQFRRFQIINIWRPLVEPVRNFPLAVCDYRSLDLSADLVATRLHFPAWLKDRENYSVKYNPGHRWYYWGSLSPDEVIFFKCYDSASRDVALVGEGTARRDLIDVAGLCPHTAFFDEKGPVTGHLRTSLEMRALLFYD
ncbi:CmcJ/NvfI family oxidoreductase [Streptomyces sp. AK02-01A]|uniref:CmcJ/NvfI family oxidoreductase n=1 Tax=Streptomyces sp. AK02-01A TaxID=3028648 RepID=UPI0029ADB9C9|nr:CmcJ/NvfI family oxidoreductase [Streptomyces sp. AK02-01A]MDX3853432.1 CmcJ/NvfI family oxidoreductase [Streptomyces sp. AK02-01A]